MLPDLHISTAPQRKEAPGAVLVGNKSSRLTVMKRSTIRKWHEPSTISYLHLTVCGYPMSGRLQDWPGRTSCWSRGSTLRTKQKRIYPPRQNQLYCLFTWQRNPARCQAVIGGSNWAQEISVFPWCLSQKQRKKKGIIVKSQMGIN